MIWITWRQQRLEILLSTVILAVIVAFLLKTGVDVSSAFQSSGVAACVAQPAQSQTCALTQLGFMQQFAPLEYPIYQTLFFIPLLVGLLIAAPVVLELEQGTYRLAWTQSITRRRWVLAKLGFVVAATVLVGGILAVVTTWWWWPLDHLDNRLNRNPFETIGFVPIAYTLFAAALCLAAGTIMRYTIVAIGITLGGFMGVRLFIQTQIRYYHYLPPQVKSVPVGAPAGLPTGAYIVTNAVNFSPAVMHACLSAHANVAPDAGPVQTCLRQHGVVTLITYQPAGRFWVFQGIESALFLAMAVLLFGLTIWWVQRRIT